MLSQACQVINKKGIHARAAAKIVETVCGYNSQVFLNHAEVRAPADSLIKLLTLNAPFGVTINIEVDGSDEVDCLHALVELFACGFGE